MYFLYSQFAALISCFKAILRRELCISACVPDQCATQQALHFHNIAWFLETTLSSSCKYKMEIIFTHFPPIAQNASGYGTQISIESLKTAFEIKTKCVGCCKSIKYYPNKILWLSLHGNYEIYLPHFSVFEIVFRDSCGVYLVPATIQFSTQQQVILIKIRLILKNCQCTK